MSKTTLSQHSAGPTRRTTEGCLRRIVPLVVLALFGLARPAAAGGADECAFRVHGTFEVVSTRGANLLNDAIW